MARKRANLTDLLNNLTFKTLHDKYKLIAQNAHTWEGLPDGIEERHVERWLYSHGRAVFFRAPGQGYMCLEVHDGGNLNPYGDPLNYRAVAYGQQWLLQADDCVIIRNNILNLATDPFIMFYVNKLTEAERTMDVNLKACKTPIIFACDDKDVLSFKRMFQQVDGNVPACFVDRGLNLDSITAFQTGVKFMGNDIQTYVRGIESELLTFLGENNVSFEKRERSITDEVNANNQLIQSFAQLQLQARQKACEAINEKFGLNIRVSRRVVEKPVDNTEEGEDIV